MCACETGKLCRDRIDRVFEQIVKLEFGRTLHLDAYSKVDFPAANAFEQVRGGKLTRLMLIPG